MAYTMCYTVMQNGACVLSSGKFPGAKRERERERGHVLKCLRTHKWELGEA